MNALVTGAQGCIGAWVVKSLLRRGAAVISYDLDETPSRLAMIASRDEIAKVRFETGKIEDTARIKSLVKDSGVTHIVHLAAVLMPYCQANPVAGGMINVIGTLNVFEAARDAGRPVRVVYASSAAVWGPGEAYEDRPLSEEDPLKPTSFYGIFKQSNESCARVFHALHGISSMGLRPWTVYGAGRDKGLTGDPTLAMKAVALGRTFRIRLSGSMDMQYVGDVAESFVECLISRVEGAHIFNLAGDIASIPELIGMMDELRPGAARLISYAGPQVPVATRMDDRHLRSLVPGIPRTSLKNGIASTLDLFDHLRSENRLTADELAGL
jgi:nucleoside-diphosphate-sugar epimerase